MRRFLILAVLFGLLFLIPNATALQPAVSGGLGGEAAGGWSDDFTTCTDTNLEDRTGWHETVVYGTGTNVNNGLLCDTDNVERKTNANGSSLVILATHTPTDNDYTVQADYYADAESGEYYFIMARATVTGDGSDDFTGYIAYFDQGQNQCNVIRYDNGAVAETLVDGQSITNYDWTTPITVLMSVTTNGSDVDIDIDIEGNEEANCDVTDTGTVESQVGYGGFGAYWDSSPGTDVHIDNYVHTD